MREKDEMIKGAQSHTVVYDEPARTHSEQKSESLSQHPTQTI